MKKRLIIAAMIAVLIGTAVVHWFARRESPGVVCTMDAKLCPDGSAVGRSGPKCEFAPCPIVTPLADGMVVLDQPLPGSMVSSPLIISGKARGTWFFEASFPVTLTDWDGKIIAQAPAQATADWMTTEWVPFEVTLTFTNPGMIVSNRGSLILQKDNPSGLPEYDDYREITVFFK